MDDRSSWQIKDEATLTELVALMNLSAEEIAAMKDMLPEAQASAPEMTKTFYERLFAHAATAEYLQNVSVDRLHGMVQTWFAELFSGKYDTAYAQRRLTIGHVHVKIGLPVRYPLAMLDVVMPFGEQVAAKHANPTLAAQAFRKVLALDVAIFNQAYEDNQLKHLAELVGGERLARRLLAGT
ncbi:protoglobin domain-containing protein [Candidatus Oscillochloris fontis]|uniref:protoglobin domain-containing protein n=1 Tax=Candidatus Oscillochloris fontis TaxID=2496868 RepID=UPI00101C4F9C|nr:protoglobin domain-containing protein [Candidatus Oscillochloris fontis]